MPIAIARVSAEATSFDRRPRVLRDKCSKSRRLVVPIGQEIAQQRDGLSKGERWGHGGLTFDATAP